MNRALLAVALSIAFVVQCESSSPAVEEKLYLLEATASHQWCVYPTEADWNADVQRQQATVVATVEHTGDRVVTIAVTEQDATGDWIVYDNYTMGGDGQPRSLKRTANILPGERSEERVFQIRAGRATQQRQATRQLRTGKPLRSAETWLPKVPVVTRIQAFAFASLIAPERLKNLPSKLCVAVAR